MQNLGSNFVLLGGIFRRENDLLKPKQYSNVYQNEKSTTQEPI